jgi:hypothetical protein
MIRVLILPCALAIGCSESSSQPSTLDSGIADTDRVDSADSGGVLEVDALPEPTDTLPPCVDADYHVTLEGDSGLRLTQGCGSDPAPSWKLAACCGEDPMLKPAAAAVHPEGTPRFHHHGTRGCRLDDLRQHAA